MEPRQTRRIFVLSAAVVVVTLALWFDPPAEEPARVEVFTPAPTVDRVEVVRRDGRILLVRRDEAWWVAGAVEQRADEPEVRRLLDAIGGLRYADPVAVPADTDPAEFGLGDEPWATIHLDGPDGLQTIILGDPAEVGFRSYVRGPDGEVMVARAGPHALVGQSATAFADRRLLSWPTEEVVEASLTGPNRTLAVRRDGRSWLVGDRWRGDHERVGAWLRVWGSVRLDGGTAPETVDWTLTFTGANGAVLTAGLAFDGTEAQIQLSDGRSGAATLEPSLLELVPRQLAATSLLGLDRSVADEVTVELGRSTWAGRRNGSAWQSELDEGSSWDVVTALSQLPQVPAPTARRRPPRRPWGTITVVRDDVETSVLLARRSGDVHLAWQPGALHPVAVPATAIEDVLAELVTE